MCMCGDVRGRERAILLGLRRVGEGDAIHHFARLYAVLAAVTAVAVVIRCYSRIRTFLYDKKPDML